MSIQAPLFTPQLMQYLRQISETESPVLAHIRAQTTHHRLGKMVIAPEQAALLTWLARLINTQNYLEIGTFTGYSSTAMALALPEHARLTCCDISVTFTDEAQQHWRTAGIAHKITLHLQPAIITLDELIVQGKSGTYDFALIDADKPTTPHYYERCLKLVRHGGIIAIDNLLLGGRIVQPQPEQSTESHRILRQFNAGLPHDSRIIALTLPLGDGLTLLQKK